MCLISIANNISNPLSVATKDLVTYKFLDKYNGIHNVIYRSPYYFFRYHLNVLYKTDIKFYYTKTGIQYNSIPSFGQLWDSVEENLFDLYYERKNAKSKIISNDNCIQINEGFHSTIVPLEHFFNEPSVVVCMECIIPAGSLYYISHETGSVASNQIIISREISILELMELES